MVIDAETALITAGFGFLSLLVTTFYHSYSADKQRRWDREDANRVMVLTAEALAVKTEAENQKLLALVHAVGMELASKQDANRQAVTGEIGKVGEMATVAFKEANDVNRKLADLHQASVAATNETKAAVTAAGERVFEKLQDHDAKLQIHDEWERSGKKNHQPPPAPAPPAQ